MPFVKKTQSQAAGPSSASGSPLFVGRTGEVLFFVHNILKPEAPTHNILSISGQGGVGKSTLLARFIEETHQAPFENYCLTALVDERQATPVGMMEKFAQQLQIAGEFEKMLRGYKEALRRQHAEQKMLRDTLVGSVPDLAGAVVEGVPVAGPLLREGAKITATYLLKDHQASQTQQYAELLETAIDDLTRAFATELNHLAETTIAFGSVRKKRQRRIILFFDTFEQLAAEATPWLLDHFLDLPVSSNVVLVVAGRDPIEHTSPDDPKRWLSYCDDGIIYWMSLNSFTEDETRMYLVKKGITDVERIASIWQLSRGLPLYLGLLTSNPQGGIDPTKDVVVNFLRWIPGQEHIKRQLALDAALLSRSFNQDDLEVFSYIPESDRVPLYQWLTGQPFVRSRAQDGRHLYHDVARDLFSRHLYQRSQKHYCEIRRELAAYYQELLEKSQVEGGQEVYRSEEWLELLLAVVYQLLLLPDQASHIKAIEYVLQAYYYPPREQQNKEIVRALRDLSQEPSPPYISSAARSVALQLLHYIERYQKSSQEHLKVVDALLENVKHVSSFPPDLLADIYYSRGSAYRMLGKKELHLENYQQALKLYGPMNYTKRGWVYHFSGNFQEALAFQNRALEHNPRDAGAYIGRGWAYLYLEEYQRAIADFDYAASLDPHVNPGGRSNGLRWAYYCIGQYQQALSANDYFLEQNPWGYYLFQSQCFRSLKDYQHSIDACNYALELAQKRITKAEIYFQRGLTYLWLKDLEQAQANFTPSCELESYMIHIPLMAEWTGLCGKIVDPAVSERLEAIATVADSLYYHSYSVHICQGIALLLRRYFREALVELEQALRPKPDHDEYKWEVHFWKGMAYAFLGQDEEAVAAVEKALESELPPILLAPLRWFEQERPDFYWKYVVPLLTKHV